MFSTLNVMTIIMIIIFEFYLNLLIKLMTNTYDVLKATIHYSKTLDHSLNYIHQNCGPIFGCTALNFFRQCLFYGIKNSQRKRLGFWGLIVWQTIISDSNGKALHTQYCTHTHAMLWCSLTAQTLKRHHIFGEETTLR